MHTPLDGEQESGGCRTFDGLSPEALRTAFPISVNTTHTSSKFAKLCKILQNFAKFCKILQSFANFAKFCKVLQNFAKLCKTLQNFAKFCKILQPLGERSGDVYGCSEAEFMMTKMTIY